MSALTDTHTRNSISALLDELSFDFEQIPAPPPNGAAHGDDAPNDSGTALFTDFTFGDDAPKPATSEDFAPSVADSVFIPNAFPAEIVVKNWAIKSWSETLELLAGRFVEPLVEIAQIETVEELTTTAPRSFAQLNWSETLDALAGRRATRTLSRMPVLPENLDPRMRWRNTATRTPGASIAEFAAEMNID